MNHYQTGDSIVDVNGQPMTARLTLGVLAQISDAVDARGPLALAHVIKAARPVDITAIVAACLRPLNGPVALTDVEARRVFTQLYPIFQQAFSSGDNS